MWPQGQTSFNWSQVMAGGGVGMPQVSTIPQTPGANPEQVSDNPNQWAMKAAQWAQQKQLQDQYQLQLMQQQQQQLQYEQQMQYQQFIQQQQQQHQQQQHQQQQQQQHQQQHQQQQHQQQQQQHHQQQQQHHQQQQLMQQQKLPLPQQPEQQQYLQQYQTQQQQVMPVQYQGQPQSHTFQQTQFPVGMSQPVQQIQTRPPLIRNAPLVQQAPPPQAPPQPGVPQNLHPGMINKGGSILPYPSVQAHSITVTQSEQIKTSVSIIPSSIAGQEPVTSSSSFSSPLNKPVIHTGINQRGPTSSYFHSEGEPVPKPLGLPGNTSHRFMSQISGDPRFPTRGQVPFRNLSPASPRQQRPYGGPSHSWRHHPPPAQFQTPHRFKPAGLMKGIPQTQSDFNEEGLTHERENSPFKQDENLNSNSRSSLINTSSNQSEIIKDDPLMGIHDKQSADIEPEEKPKTDFNLTSDNISSSKSIPGLDLVLEKPSRYENSHREMSFKPVNPPVSSSKVDHTVDPPVKDVVTQESPQPTNKMIASLGKIVSQLQALQGLSNSLTLIEKLPSMKQGDVTTDNQNTTFVEKEETVDIIQDVDPEKEKDDETKRKVAALLENESDSEGDENIEQKKEDVYHSVSTREFSGFEQQPPMETCYHGDQYTHQDMEMDYPPEMGMDYSKTVPPPETFGSVHAFNRAHYRDVQGDTRRDRVPYDTDYPDHDDYDKRFPYYESDPYQKKYPPHLHDNQSDYKQSPTHFIDRDQNQFKEQRYNSLPPRDYSNPHEHPSRRLEPPDEVYPHSRAHANNVRYHDSPVQTFGERNRQHPSPQLSQYPVEDQYQTAPYKHPNDPSYDLQDTSRSFYPPREMSEAPIESYDYQHTCTSTSLLSSTCIQSVDYDHGRTFGERGYDTSDQPVYSQHESYTDSQAQRDFDTTMSAFPHGFNPASLLPLFGGALTDLQQKGLPKWLRSELEDLERKKRKDAEREAQRGGNSRDHMKSHRSWKDEIAEEEEEEEQARGKRKEKERSKSPRYRKRSHSLSPGQFEQDSRERFLEGSSERIEEEVDEEERQLRLITKVRQMLTEILLDVTNTEMRDIVMEVLNIKKPKSKSKSSETNLLALNVYGSPSDSEETHITEEKEQSPTLDPETIAAAFQGSSANTMKKEKSHSKDKKKSSKWDSKESTSSSKSISGEKRLSESRMKEEAKSITSRLSSEAPVYHKDKSSDRQLLLKETSISQESSRSKKSDSDVLSSYEKSDKKEKLSFVFSNSRKEKDQKDRTQSSNTRQQLGTGFQRIVTIEEPSTNKEESLRNRDSDRERNEDRDRNRGRDKERDRDGDRDRDRHRDKDRDRDRGRDRDRDRDRDRHQSRHEGKDDTSSSSSFSFSGRMRSDNLSRDKEKTSSRLKNSSRSRSRSPTHSLKHKSSRARR